MPHPIVNWCGAASATTSSARSIRWTWVRSICSLFSASEEIPVGRIIAVVGAKGGVGASTIAHNVAWAIARDLETDSVVIDLDLAFGTASLDYNKDPVQNIANALFAPDRPDSALMERLLAKCTDHLSLLAAPATLERVLRFRRASLRCDLRYNAHDNALHRARHSAPMVGMDQARFGRRGRYSDCRRAGPRQYAQHQEHAEYAQGGAAQTTDHRYIVSIRSACRSVRRSTRANSPKAVESQPIAAIPFDSRMFGTAANNGQMIAEISAGHRTTKMLLQIARRLTGRGEPKKSRESFLSPIIRKLRAG